jgi:hypothetical protein
MGPQLQEMLDEFQLRKLVHRYCRAVDRGDDAQLRSLYHHDAQDHHGAGRIPAVRQALTMRLSGLVNR